MLGKEFLFIDNLLQKTLKKNVAQFALSFIPHDCILGVGTGSTANELIKLLPTVKDKIKL